MLINVIDSHKLNTGSNGEKHGDHDCRSFAGLSITEVRSVLTCQFGVPLGHNKNELLWDTRTIIDFCNNERKDVHDGGIPALLR